MSLITYLTRVHFADRVLHDALAEEMAHLGATRPLVIVDAAGEEPTLLERLLDALPKTSAAAPVRKVSAPATARDGERLVRLYSELRCDSVIGFGGGAALELARLVGLAGGDATRLAQSLGGGELRVRRMTLQCPVIAIPTVTENGLGLCPTLRLADEGGAQIVLPGGGALPSVMLCDPRLTLAAAPQVTAAAGMDALALCIEAYLCTTFNPPADGIALEGVRRAGRYLVRAIRDGSDLDARREVLAAALNGGLAAQKGLGGSHALAHALAAPLRESPGALQAAVLPQVLEFNLPAVRDRLPIIGAALGSAPAKDFATTLAQLLRQLSLPTRLDDPALDDLARTAISRAAEADPANRTNPRLATAADYAGMLDALLVADPAA